MREERNESVDEKEEVIKSYNDLSSHPPQPPLSHPHFFSNSTPFLSPPVSFPSYLPVCSKNSQTTTTYLFKTTIVLNVRTFVPPFRTCVCLIDNSRQNFSRLPFDLSQITAYERTFATFFHCSNLLCYGCVCY